MPSIEKRETICYNNHYYIEKPFSKEIRIYEIRDRYI